MVCVKGSTSVEVEVKAHAANKSAGWKWHPDLKELCLKRRDLQIGAIAGPLDHEDLPHEIFVYVSSCNVGVFHPHYTNEDTEVQRAKATCPVTNTKFRPIKRL